MGDPIKITSTELLPLKGRHYATEVRVGVDVNDQSYVFRVDICGHAPNASLREKDRGWVPDWGMEDTETEAHWLLSQIICEALERMEEISIRVS